MRVRGITSAIVAGLLIAVGSAAAQNRVTVNGIAYDSLHARPLSGAFVVLVGTQMTATSDSAGRFSFENVAPGNYRVAAQHDVIDALGMSAVGASAKVTDGREVIHVFVPSFTQMWKVVCGPKPPAADTGFVFGSVRPAPGMTTMSHVVVAASWVDLVAKGKTVTQKLKTLETNADSSGNFALCGVPTTTSIGIRATTDAAESGRFDVDPLGTERISRRDVKLGMKLADIVAAKRGATLAGKVFADSNAGPISNAEVFLGESDLKSTTNDKGEYSIVDILPGSHTLHVRRIGYAEAVARVDLEEGESRSRDIVLSKVTVLDSVGVSARSVPREEALRGFEEHQRLGLGKFLTRAELAKAGERPLGSLLQQFNGLQVVRGRDGKTYLFARRGRTSLGAQNCPVMIYLDGVAFSPTAQPDINEFLPSDLEGVEYFAGAGRIPPEYNRLGSPCGVLVLHSRKRLP